MCATSLTCNWNNTLLVKLLLRLWLYLACFTAIPNYSRPIIIFDYFYIKYHSTVARVSCKLQSFQCQDIKGRVTARRFTLHYVYCIYPFSHFFAASVFSQKEKQNFQISLFHLVWCILLPLYDIYANLGSELSVAPYDYPECGYFRVQRF